MATAQTHTAAPQLEARLRHALPLGAHLVVGLCERVVARIPVGGNGYVAWNCRGRAGKNMCLKQRRLMLSRLWRSGTTEADIMCFRRLETQRQMFAEVAVFTAAQMSIWHRCTDASEKTLCCVERRIYQHCQRLQLSPELSLSPRRSWLPPRHCTKLQTSVRSAWRCWRCREDASVGRRREGFSVMPSSPAY